MSMGDGEKEGNDWPQYGENYLGEFVLAAAIHSYSS